MRGKIGKRFVLVVGLTITWTVAMGNAAERRISVAEYRNRMEAGWLGQMAAVAWGAPTEFKWSGKIIPEDRVPDWSDSKINDAFGQDDLYVEMTFLRTLEQYGLDVSIRRAGIEFANTEYRLWCANRAGRNNLRFGIAPPDSGHPAFNKCPNDIDYQIEADYSGLIAPGLPQAAVDLGWLFGRLMNYGDGVYAGQFVGAMYAEAFFERNPRAIVERALRAIPAESHYAAMVRDVLRWHDENPQDWTYAWEKSKAWRLGREFGSNGGIDARLNGAYVLIGLLYGGGNPERTITISMRCGEDSDCNPSTAMGVLGTALGLEHLPPGWRHHIDHSKKFSYTPYRLADLLAVCEQLARRIVMRYGGRVEAGADGDVFVLPAATVQPSPLVRSWEAEPPLNVRYTPEEMAEIRFPSDLDVNAAVRRVLPGWAIRDCGMDMEPGYRDSWHGREGVLLTHPLNRETACVLHREVEIPVGKSRFVVEVGHHARGDFELVVKVAGEEVLRTVVGAQTATNHWFAGAIDLSRWAGQRVSIEVANQANGWSNEAAYWHALRIESE